MDEIDKLRKRIEELEANQRLRDLEASKGRSLFVPYTITEEQANRIIELLEQIVEKINESKDV